MAPLLKIMILSSCDGLLINSNVDVLCDFSLNVGISDALEDLLTASAIAVEIVYLKGWYFHWLQIDPMLVSLDFKSPKIVVI